MAGLTLEQCRRSSIQARHEALMARKCLKKSLRDMHAVRRRLRRCMGRLLTWYIAQEGGRAGR